MGTYENIKIITAGQEGEYPTGLLLDYPYLKIPYKMIAIYLGKKQALDADQKAIQKINFTRNLGRQATSFLIIEEAKETILYFSQGTLGVL